MSLSGNEMKQIHQELLLTSVVESRPQPGCPDWASVAAEAFAAKGVFLLDPLGLEQQVLAAGWWVLLDDFADQAPSVAVTLPGIAVEAFGQVSVAVVAHQELCGPQQKASVGIQTVASVLVGNFLGFVEEHPVLEVVAGLRVPG